MLVVMMTVIIGGVYVMVRDRVSVLGFMGVVFFLPGCKGEATVMDWMFGLCVVHYVLLN